MTRIACQSSISAVFQLAILFLILDCCWGFADLPRIHTVLQQHRNPSTSILLYAAGMGMGVVKGKKDATKNKKKGTATFDVSASLIRLEKQYEELLFQSAKSFARDNKDDNDDEDSQDRSASATSPEISPSYSFEYVVAARSTSGMSSHTAVSDWVPIAQLVICTLNDTDENGVSDETRQAAVSLFCRELAHAASMGAPVFQNVARKDLQYSLETVDSFYKYVYDVLHGKVDSAMAANGQTMSKSEARSVLRLQDDENDIKVIKQSYRKLSFDLHPDRLAQTKNNGAVDEENNTVDDHDFHKVKLAYDTLSSGVRSNGSSWYQSLGGRARTDFTGPITLISIDAAQQFLDKAAVKSAVCGIDGKLVQSFVARNQAAV